MQKPFAFYLLPFALIMAFSSCSLNPNLQTPGQDYLQGDWQQDSIKGQNALLNYSLYQLKFTCDSFYFAIRSYSKINTGADSCMQSGHWTEYIKGTYLQKNDTLHLKGLFCNQNWTIKNDKGCFRYGDYEEFFKIRKKTDSFIQFASTTSVIPIEAHLIKKYTCHPKPI